MDFKQYVNYEEFESKKIEFKEIVSHKNYEKWAKEIVAFANTDGGKIFLVLMMMKTLLESARNR